MSSLHIDSLILQNVKRDIIDKGLLTKKKETCFIYSDRINKWTVSTNISKYNSCSSNLERPIMAHTHPLRIGEHKTHKIEINYYPSYVDIMKPIKDDTNEVHLIITPIGIFIAIYKHKIPIDHAFFDAHKKMLDSIFYVLHCLNRDMTEDKSQENILVIKKQKNGYDTSFVEEICQNITHYINYNILRHTQFPNDYSLSFVDIFNMSFLGKGKKRSNIRRKSKNFKKSLIRKKPRAHNIKN